MTTTTTRVQTIAKVMDDTRMLTKYFITQLDPEQIYWQPEINGQKFNSAYWIVAHLIWSENELILGATDAPLYDKAWVEDFGYEKPHDIKPEHPSYEELLAALDEVHALSMESLSKLSDDALDEAFQFSIANWDSTKAKVLRHCIRHEGQHMGQISWLVKMHEQNKTS